MSEGKRALRESIQICQPKRTSASHHRSGGDAPGRVYRCAIYTRKSSEEGLEQDFNSLQAQREACEAYIASQRHEGWRLLPDHFDDGGFSGGSMERPGLKRLLQVVEAGRVDVVVVYKVDRLTRALADFAKIVEIFDTRGASFVSVTQSFNTTTSMGRLTLNVLLSFAQFEREVTAERIRDKIAASKRKGIFMGGPVPLGYRVENRKLLVAEEEADTLRTIFRTYLATRSTIVAARELDRLGIRTRTRRLRDGQTIGGIPLTYGPLQTLLRNRVYIGEIIHKGQSFPGEHRAIIDRETFDAVQQMLDAQRSSENRSAHRMRSLLTGKIFDSQGNRMAPSHTNKGGVRYRYYTSRALLEGRREEAGKPSRIRADEIEALVVKSVRDEAARGQGRGLEFPAHHLDDDHALISAIVDRVDVHGDRIEVTLRAEGAAPVDRSQSPATSVSDALSQLIMVPCSLGSVPPHREVVGAASPLGSAEEERDAASLIRNRDRLIVGIHKARGWLDALMDGTAKDVAEIAAREGKSRRNVSMMINLAFLSPAIIESMLANEDTALTATALAQALPDEWESQGALLTKGFNGG
jgi:DNA invertase Pin-like site-specific DNA recombinase